MIASVSKRVSVLSRPINQSVRSYYPSTVAQRNQLLYLWPFLGLVPVVALLVSGLEEQDIEMRSYLNTISGGENSRRRNENIRISKSE